MRVVQEVADDDLWALVGAAAIQLRGCDASSPNLEFIMTEPAAISLAQMLDIPSSWSQGEHLAARRLHFMRDRVPVFVHAGPTFHGTYDSLTPVDIPSLWDARERAEVGGAEVFLTPLEWELMLAVVLDAPERVAELSEYMRTEGYDGRLLTRLMREGHLETATEEAVWATLENGAVAS